MTHLLPMENPTSKKSKKEKPSSGAGTGVKRCGIQFMPEDVEEAMDISEMVGRIERTLHVAKDEGKPKLKRKTPDDRYGGVGSFWYRLDL